jgi:hypothetical protein
MAGKPLSFDGTDDEAMKLFGLKSRCFLAGLLTM